MVDITPAPLHPGNEPTTLNGIPLDSEPTTEPSITLPDGTIPMVGTDGKLYKVPTSSYKVGIENNWRPATQQEVNKELGIEEEVKKHSTLGYGLNTFANEATLGVKEYIENKDKTPDELQKQKEVEERLAEKNPTTHALASAAGFIAPMLVPGVGEAGEVAEGLVRGGASVAEHAIPEVAAKLAGEAATKAGLDTVSNTAISAATKAGFEGASKEGIKSAAETAIKSASDLSLSRKIASSAANYGTQGALYSTPLALTQAAYGDPESAAETMLWGGGLGLALGAGAGLLGEGAKLAAKGLDKGIETGTDYIGKISQEEDMGGLSYQQRLALNAAGMSKSAADKLNSGGRLQRASEFLNNEIFNKPNMSFEDIQKAVEDHKSLTGEAIGNNIKSVDKMFKDDPELLKTHGMLLSEEGQKIFDQIIQDHPELKTSMYSTEMNELKKITDSIVEQGNGKPVDMAKVQEVKEMLGSKLGANKIEPTIKDQLKSKAYAILKTDMENIMESVYTSQNPDSKELAEYIKNKDMYGAASDILQASRKAQLKGWTKLLPPGISDLHGGVGGAGGLIVKHWISAALHPLLGPIASPAIAYGVLPFLKKWAEDKGLQTGAYALKQLAKDPASIPFIGALIAKDGMQALDKKINEIPAIITAKNTAVRGASQAMKHMLGGDTTGLSKDQQYKKLTNNITALAANPSLMANSVVPIAQVASGDNGTLAQHTIDKHYSAINYLAASVPKNPQAPQPFSKNDWKPTATEKNTFLKQVDIVHNPMSIFDSIKKGNLTQAEVNTLRAVYPKIAERITNKISEFAFSPDARKVSFQTRLALSKLTGMDLDPSLKNLAAIQQAVSSAPTTTPQPAPTHGRRGSTRPKLNNLPSLETNTGRIGHNSKEK